MSQRLYFSRDAEVSLVGSEFFCGTGNVVKTSVSNEMILAYTSAAGGYSGYFSCQLTTVPLTGSNCDCGWNVNTRIVNGVDARVNEFVSHVGLVELTDRQIFCGGAIISYYYILSAAHCFVANKVASKIVALVGDHDTSTSADTVYAALYKISAIIQHELYNANADSQNYDIALLKTESFIHYKRAVGPACLPYRFVNNDAFFNGKIVDAAGWGSMEYGGIEQKFCAFPPLIINFRSRLHCAPKGLP